MKQLANVVLLGIMLGAVYTHYTLRDRFERMAPGLVFSLLLITRLIIYRQVTQREKGQAAMRTTKKSKVPTTEEEDEEQGDTIRESGDAESPSDEETKPTATSKDKKKKKKIGRAHV